jgi:hypothetical protein
VLVDWQVGYFSENAKSPTRSPGFSLYLYIFYFTGWGITSMPLGWKIFLVYFLLVEPISLG